MNPLNILIFLYIFYQTESYLNFPDFFLVERFDNCLNSIDAKFIEEKEKVLCICKEEYATEPFERDDNRCNYKRKKQLIVFILEIIGFGIGHIYANNYLIGIFKLIYWLISITFCVLMRKEYVKRGDNDERVIIITFISFLLNVGLIIWYAYDLASIGMGNYLDGNGIDLFYWNEKKRFNGH